MAELTDPWRLGPLQVPNRVLLAPLAGIGNWFVRLQARRYGAGMAFSEMVSSHAVHHGNEKTCVEMLRIHPAERAGDGGPVSIQLFGESPPIMRSAARRVAAVGADGIDINMGCPVPKVFKTGAGAGLLRDPDLAVELARAAGEGVAEAGRKLPVTVKLRSGVRPGDRSGFELAHRLVAEAGVAAISFHPRSAAVHHKGEPDYELAAELARTLPAPVILTGGLQDEESVRGAFAATGATAVMLARGSLGNPWLFDRLVGGREDEPTAEEVLRELHWTIDRAVEHLGQARATRYLRKFYPWYVGRLGLERGTAKELCERLQRTETLAQARNLLDARRLTPALAA
ncbi:MAG TPA: tRNA-dihydrouridine synthase [Solirubrobacteraceae bacterium]|nr:tRNA-dihydrouridine synthase [Solirubrobacteraceae bacterium]